MHGENLKFPDIDVFFLILHR